MFSPSLLILGLLAMTQAKVQFLGIGIAGGDFGCTIDGSCPTDSVQLPLSSLGGGDGQGQMNHFVKNDGLNMFRLPVSWQFLVNNQLGGTLNGANLGKYDQVMQACLATGAHCMIDIHNFARWNGGIIGQGGPTDGQFVSLWQQLATKYAANDKIVFELMNEPHDLDINLWAQTCQKAVTAIRNAGATSQMILLPGTNFDSAATLVSSGSADALMAIRNPDGTADNLLLDIHKYLDEDNSGTHAACTTDNRDAFGTVAAYLRQAGRKGLVSETGASSDPSCLAAFCSQNEFINQNSDVFVGLVGWGAGSFSSSYILSLTPTKNGNAFVDSALMMRCVVNTWLNAQSLPAPSSPSSGPSPSASSSSTSRAATTATSATTSRPPRPSIADTTMVMSSLAAGRLTGTGAAEAMPTTLLVAAGTPTKGLYGGSPTYAPGAAGGGGNSRNGSSSSTSATVAPSNTAVLSSGGRRVQGAAAGPAGLIGVAVLAVLFL